MADPRAGGGGGEDDGETILEGPIRHTMTLAESAACREAAPDVRLVPAGPQEPALFAAPRDGGTARYVLGRELGRGGAGRVVAALDREIGRVVAVKVLKAGTNADREEVRRFLEEARVAGQLEHPGIIPAYDLGALADGQPFYTMRVVEHRSLREVLAEPPPRREWPLARLCGVFVQVCRALSYAHARGVVHRDVKPDNILLGGHGEVYLTDWGIAKLLSREPVTPGSGGGERTAFAGTVAGTLLGTPGYMAPEQARGEGGIDHRVDLFALGAILYEVLTGRPAFDGTTALSIVLVALERDPEPPRALLPSCPLVLEDLCLRLLSKRAQDRPGSAEAAAQEVEGYLEGAKEKARRQEEAKRLVAAAGDPLECYGALGGERERLLVEARAALRDVAPHEPVEAKRLGWALEDRAQAAEAERAVALGEAVERLVSALSHDPDCREARERLADLHWSRAREARAERREAARVYNEALVRQYDDGRYARLLAADSGLSVTSTPPGALVLLHRLVERDRLLVPGEGISLGRAPLGEKRVEPGSYVLLLRHEGYAEARHPVLLGLGERREVNVRLRTAAEIGLGFVLVPGGRCAIGGDREAFDPLPPQEVDVPDFAIARFPVTFGEYLEFVNDLEGRDPAEAARRLPRIEEYGEKPVVRDDRGVWVPSY